MLARVTSHVTSTESQRKRPREEVKAERHEDVHPPVTDLVIASGLSCYFVSTSFVRDAVTDIGVDAYACSMPKLKVNAAPYL